MDAAAPTDRTSVPPRSDPPPVSPLASGQVTGQQALAVEPESGNGHGRIPNPPDRDTRSPAANDGTQSNAVPSLAINPEQGTAESVRLQAALATDEYEQNEQGNRAPAQSFAPLPVPPPVEETCRPAAPRQPPPPVPAGPPVSGSRDDSGGGGKRPRRRWGCIIGFALFAILIAVVIGGFVFLSNLMETVGVKRGGLTGAGQEKISEEVISGDDLGTDEKIAVIEVRGIITGGNSLENASSRRLSFELASARKDPDVVAIILDMDTPGGEVTASDELYQEVRKCRSAGKPVITCMRSLAASGGYFIASGSNWIVANRLTLTGSVGVIISTINYHSLFEKIGLQGEVYKSGAMKDMLNGGRERTDTEVAYVNHLVQQTFREFAAVVAEGRERYETADEVIASEFGDGRVLNGDDAFRLGLVDQLGYFEDAVAKARELSDAPMAKVVRYRRAFRLSEILLSMRADQTQGLRGLLHAEAREVKPGRLYFLLPTVLP